MKTGDLLKKWRGRLEEVTRRDKTAQQKNILAGRCIKMPVADGFAYYEIVRENKITVKIRRITGLGDDYNVFYWGDEATIDKNFARGLLRDN